MAAEPGRRAEAVPAGAVRLEAAQKVTGAARYTSDVALPGQLYAGVARSPHAHARVRRVDATAARRSAGVYDVITGADTDGIDWYEEQAPLLAGRVRFVGDEVAAIAASSEEAVRDALRALEIEYEPLDAVVGIPAALADGAPLVHDGAEGNRAGAPEIYSRGDVDAGLAEADVVVESTVTTQTALHSALEPHGCNAFWDGETLVLHVSTQGIFAVRDGIARELGLPRSRVQVRARHVGGGFGAKQVAWKETMIAAVLAMRTGRPVSLMLDREAENLATGNRNATRQRVTLGARRDGRLCAISAEIEVEAGAYTVAGEASIVDGCYQALYACPNVRTRQTRVYTNAGPAVAFRAPGYVEGTFALEQAMDELGTKLGLDPFELRERNHTPCDQKTGKPYSSPDALRHCYAAVRSAFGWPARPARSRGRHKRRGVGVAAAVWLAGGSSPPAYASVGVHGDGSVSVLTGAQDIGTGTRTALAEIAAEELGVSLGRITLELGDTATMLRAPTSSGSSTLATVGRAVCAAAADAKRRVLELAAQRLGCRSETLRIDDGVVRGSHAASAGITLAELARMRAAGTIAGHGACERQPDDVAVHTFAAQCAEVEVDLETAEVTVVRLTSAPDCGRIVNRRLADSQVLGGATQGLGYALTEARIVDAESGDVLNANLENYLVPTALDVPRIDHAPVDLPDRRANELGIKGIGEPPMIPVAPAIINAVHDAVGVRIRELPLNRKRLLAALAARQESP